MSEKRKKTASILLKKPGKREDLKLTPASEWPEQGGAAGLFRVLRNGRWMQNGDEPMFMTPARVGELVAELLAGDELPAAPPVPFLPGGADMVVYVEGAGFNPRGHIKVEPYQKMDGRWYCQVWIPGGVKEFLCDDVRRAAAAEPAGKTLSEAGRLCGVRTCRTGALQNRQNMIKKTSAVCSKYRTNRR
jgi:hypothetical protein